MSSPEIGSANNALALQDEVEELLPPRRIGRLVRQAAELRPLRQRVSAQPLELCVALLVAVRRGEAQPKHTATILARTVPNELPGLLVAEHVVLAIRARHPQQRQIFEGPHVVHCVLQQCELQATDLDLEDRICHALPTVQQLSARADRLLRALLPKAPPHALHSAEDRAAGQLLRDGEVRPQRGAQRRDVRHQAIEAHVEEQLPLHGGHGMRLESRESSHGRLGVRGSHALDGLRGVRTLSERAAARHATAAGLAGHRFAAVRAAAPEPHHHGKSLEL
mmetsp:Transcript_124858/g.361163  ORF Transcript_124858/g.361163 Transcript_124858/m.361163 type:complete len:279 (+) Transcript_124858:131-967(+)